MQQRIREAFANEGQSVFSGPVEVDESYFGGKNANKHSSKKIKNANGTVGKTAVVGIKDRKTNQVQAAVVERTNQETLQAFVNARKEDGAKVYSDEHGAYIGLDNHEVVKHSVGEYVKEQAHTNGIESFWSMLKRAHKGTPVCKSGPLYWQPHPQAASCRLRFSHSGKSAPDQIGVRWQSHNTSC